VIQDDSRTLPVQGAQCLADSAVGETWSVPHQTKHGLHSIGTLERVPRCVRKSAPMASPADVEGCRGAVLAQPYAGLVVSVALGIWLCAVILGDLLW